MSLLNSFFPPLTTVAHAFGQRYELPIPLLLFVLGGAGVVLLSFIIVAGRKVAPERVAHHDHTHLKGFNATWAIVSFAALAACIAAGLFGNQEVAENIVPTLFWLVTWIAVPLSCGLLGDWTQPVNPFANLVKMVDRPGLRQMLLARKEPFKWPQGLGWWPAVLLFFALACGELVFNQTATLPGVTAGGLLAYLVLNGFMGLLYGRAWLERGEVFTVLFSTWGRLGYWRFGSDGKRGFAGGLIVPFEPAPSRVAFVLLLLVSVAFDGLLSTPLWSTFQHHLPGTITVGSTGYLLLAMLIFVVLAAVIWAVFSVFAGSVGKAGRHGSGSTASLAGLLPSLIPISFGYLLAHNIEYLVVNGQLLFPLIGNPVGRESWPLHLSFPFNDSFEPSIHVLPSAAYWYISVAIIIIVHIVAVVLAHRHLGRATKDAILAKRSEYPWVLAMVAYTMLSLWLLAQPLVKEKSVDTGYVTPVHIELVRTS